MVLECLAYSKHLFTNVISYWDAILRKYEVKEAIVKSFIFGICFYQQVLKYIHFCIMQFISIGGLISNIKITVPFQLHNF